ncbi:hypothetical protein GCM10010363_07880 [Streptomyces omiyaensis]|uniref:hypothetical protein n=1 Tax=Streptomyces omiyaensis TaxID=68247 RepID=UPI001678DDF2|nr:hypothetical protein [Streptomyces omiyaensis]GGY29825.1 hypothetical protein GCM10010363_07880 [Streptomyces omiyaensis]
MTTWTTRTTVSTRHEWEVPAREPWGADFGQVESATTAALRHYRRHYGLGDNDTVPDDALRFKVTDEAIVISFTIDAAA